MKQNCAIAAVAIAISPGIGFSEATYGTDARIYQWYLGTVAVSTQQAEKPLPSPGVARVLLLGLLLLTTLSLYGCGGEMSVHSEESGPTADSHPRLLTIAAVGDTMLGSTPNLPASPDTYFNQVKGQLRGDIVFGNLEGTLTEASESPKCSAGATECFAFRAPPSFAHNLRRAGFTAMNNANNHSFDFGLSGQEETVNALRSAGIAQAGLPGQITMMKAGGLRVALIGFAPYSDTASLIDLPEAQALIRNSSHRADVVICAIHAGAEGTDAQHLTGEEEYYAGEDRGDPERFAHMAIDAGADLILGSGPHVLRAMEIYKHRLIAYSLGNFAGYYNFATDGVLGHSVILHATLDETGAFHAGQITSVDLVDAGQPVPDSSGAGAALLALLSREDLGFRGIRLRSDGRVIAPG